MENNYGGNFGKDWLAAHRGGQHVPGAHPDRCGSCLMFKLEDLAGDGMYLAVQLTNEVGRELPEGPKRETVTNAAATIEGAANNLMRLVAQVREEMER